jgi:hypothetical protein
MSVIREVLEELWSMFVGDRRLTLLVLLLIGITAAIAALAPQFHVAAAVLILIGALAILTDSVLQAARKARR